MPFPLYLPKLDTANPITLPTDPTGTVTTTTQATTPTKVAIIHIQQAIVSTNDGKKAQADIQTRFGPKRQALEKKQQDLAKARA